MDYSNYYLNQANSSSFPVFRGMISQKGYGLGGIFRKFFSWIMPIVREHAIPVTKSIGKEVIKGAVNLAKDSLDGSDIKDSAKARLKEVINNISEKQIGRGKKRKNNNKKYKKTKYKRNKKSNLFDNF